MATSGTFTGTRGASTYGPWLILEWDRILTDIPNNRSQIRLTLKLASDRNIIFSATKSGVLDGTSFSYTGNYNGPETRTIKTKDVWVNHNSDGSRTEPFSATFDVDITWSGEWLGRLTVSGNAVIDTIPRASDYTAFTLSNTSLNYNTATTINYTLSRKSTAFDHDMTLKYGSSVIATWSASTGSLTRSLTTTEVNTILRLMSTVTSGTLTLTMQTMSGSTKIGSSKTINEGISVSSAVAPSASSMSASIFGTGRDKTLGMYIQGISKVTASFTRAAGYGASISSSTITVKKSTGANSQIIGSNSGTTPNPVSSSGTYVVTGTVKDGRGRTATVSVNITVQAYSHPSIIKFTGVRGTPSTTVKLDIDARWSVIGTSNPATIKVTSTNSTTSVEIFSKTGDVTGILQALQSYINQSDATAYTYTISVTDSFGANAQAQVRVGTSFVELTISKAKGIGVGKVHEQGSLDVAGEAYIQGKLILQPPSDLAEQPRLQIESKDVNGHGYVEFFGAGGVRRGYIGVPSSSVDYMSWASHAKDDAPGYIHLGPHNLNLRETAATYNGVTAFSSDNPVLWSGGSYMVAGQAVNPSKSIDKCPHGWMLIFSYYASGSQDYRFGHFFVHKEFPVSLGPANSSGTGPGSYFVMNSGSDIMVSKYLYMSKSTIYGFAANFDAPNNRMVLRYVLEV